MTTKIDGTLGVIFPDNTVRGSGSLIAGVFKKLSISYTGLSALATVTADAVVLEEPTYLSPIVARSVNLSINTTINWVNGLDTGTIAASTFYYVWVISDGVNIAGLASLSATAPTMPSGYTYKARVGAFKTDGTANKYPLNGIQYERRFQYRVTAGSNVTAPPTITSGTAGTTSTWATVSISNIVPTTAFRIAVQVVGPLVSGNFVGVAPNSTYTTNLGNINSAPVQIEQASTVNSSASGDIFLESSNIYYSSNQASGALLCLGWEDNL